MVVSIPELTLLIGLIAAAYITMEAFSKVEGTDVLSASTVFWVLAGSFLLSVGIAIIGPLAGIGGGVIFTPLMLGFTSIDSMVIRSTGLVVAMFSGLISGGPFFRKGLADMKIVVFGGVPIAVGALLGGMGAVYASDMLGEAGDALVNLLLGLIIAFVAYLFLAGGANTEFPEAKMEDGFSNKLGLRGAYWEETMQQRVEYRLVRSKLGFALFFVVGVTGGFFGLGGGWAVVPVLNLVMATPLKVSAACSGVLLGVGNATAIWPYILYGSLIAMFAVPWMAGQVVGGIIGAHILVKIRAGFVRKILIVILILTCVKLLLKGMEGLLGLDLPV